MSFLKDRKQAKPWDCRSKDFIDSHKTRDKIWSVGAVQDWAQAVGEQGIVPAEAWPPAPAAAGRAALKFNSPLDVEGGQNKHHGGRRRGKGQLSSSHSRTEGHGCPQASSSAGPAGTGGPSASASLPVSTHSPASPACQPTPQHQKQQETPRFSAFNLLRFGETGPPQAQACIYAQSPSPPCLSAILSSRSEGGGHWPGGEGRPFCWPQPHVQPYKAAAIPAGVRAAAGSLSEAG